MFPVDGDSLEKLFFIPLANERGDVASHAMWDTLPKQFPA